MIENIQPIYVTAEDVGPERRAYLDGEWPEYTAFTGELLREPRGLLTSDFESVTVTLSDGSAVYDIIERSEDLDRVVCRLRKPV